MYIPEGLPEGYKACMRGFSTGEVERRNSGYVIQSEDEKKETRQMDYNEAVEIRNKAKSMSDEDIEALSLEELEDLNKKVREARAIVEAHEKQVETRKKTMEGLVNGTIGTVIRRFDDTQGEGKQMEQNQNLEARSLQKYLTLGYDKMEEAEKRALVVANSGAVLPTKVQNRLITEGKYSDLLHRATIINEGAAGTIKIPIASNTAASWKVENTEEISGVSIEASPTLTHLSLGGYELMRLMTMSAATASMAAEGFMDHMLDLISSEVVETLENSFINGDGTTEPITGLVELTYATNTDQVLTASAATKIAPANIAKAISLLPQKYARNAIILMNAATAYEQVALFKGTSEYAYNMADGAQRFMGKEIIISEHVPDDEVYVIDPKELYVRFAQPISVDADKSSGFRSASIDLRALAVVDAKWNQKAVVRVGLGA